MGLLRAGDAEKEENNRDAPSRVTWQTKPERRRRPTTTTTQLNTHPSMMKWKQTRLVSHPADIPLLLLIQESPPSIYCFNLALSSANSSLVLGFSRLLAISGLRIWGPGAVTLACCGRWARLGALPSPGVVSVGAEGSGERQGERRLAGGRGERTRVGDVVVGGVGPTGTGKGGSVASIRGGASWGAQDVELLLVGHCNTRVSVG